MAENEPYEGDDFEDAEAAPSPDYIPTRLHLANLLLARLITKDVLDDLHADRVRCIVIDVPGASWVAPLVAAARRLLPKGAHCIDGSEAPRRYLSQDGRHVDIAAGGEPILAVSQAAERNLDASVVAACDLRFTLAGPDGAILEELSRLCLRGTIAASEFDGIGLTALDFNELAACFPSNASTELALSRLRSAIERKSAPRSSDVPSLESAHGYGAAQRWATDLRVDLDDYRHGRIPIEDVDRGCLIHGPTGTGKSLLAQIVAQACSLPIVASSIGELFAASNGDLGSVIHSVRAVFAKAKQVSPCLLFLDELDALPNRSTISARGRDWWLPVITDFLTMLDSTMSDRSGIVVMGATNHLEHIDPAILRPGRLERAIWVGPPDPPALANILRYYLGDDLPDADLLWFARARPGSTGAEAEEWARAARRRARRAGRPMAYEDLAVVVLPSDPRTPAERKRAAVHEAGHALASVLLDVDTIESVTIQRSNRSGGHTAFTRRIPDFSMKSELDDRVTTLLAGRAAEEVMLGSVSSASGGDAASDLALATNLVALSHTALGFGSDIAWRGTPDQTLMMTLADPMLRTAVNDDLARMLARSVTLLRANEIRLAEVAEELERRVTLSGEDVRALVLSPVGKQSVGKGKLVRRRRNK